MTLSERVRHDSVSTGEFKFQAHRLFHIYKSSLSSLSHFQELMLPLIPARTRAGGKANAKTEVGPKRHSSDSLASSV